MTLPFCRARIIVSALMLAIAQARTLSGGTCVASKSGSGGSNPPPIWHWLRRALSVRRGVGKQVAAALGIETSAVSRLRSNKRRVQLSEIPIIERITGESAPVLSVMHRQEGEARIALGNGGSLGDEHAITLVRVLVVIAPSVWREAGVSVAVTERTPSSPDPRVVGMKQYACKIEAQNRYAICVPYSEMRIKPIAGDIVHVRRTDSEGRYEDTLRMVRITPTGKVQLRLEGAKTRDATNTIDFPSKDHGSPSIEIRGLVVGFYDAVQF